MRPATPISLLAGVAVLGVLVAWMAIGRQPPGHVRVTATAPAAARTMAPQAAGTSAAASEFAMSHGATDNRAGQVEICGLGWVDKNPDEAGKATIDKQLAQLEGQESREVAARLLADPTPFAQATGTVLQFLSDASSRHQATNATSAASASDQDACEGEACPKFKELQDRAAASAGLADQLARQALQTLDPRVYALAYRTCSADDAVARNVQSVPLQRPWPSLPFPSTLPAPTACKLLSTQQWARLEPDNGTPWLYGLQDAAGKGEAAVDEALFHIAGAKRFDDGAFALAGEIARRASGDVSGVSGVSGTFGASDASEDAATLGAHAAAMSAIGFSAAQPAPVDVLLAACRAKALADSNRRQLCEGAANALVDRSDSLLLAIMGGTIGRSLGWDPARRDALVGLQYALLDAWTPENGQTREGAAAAMGPSAARCADRRTILQRLARESTIGEVGMAREWATSHGTTQEAYTRRAREARLRHEPQRTM